MSYRSIYMIFEFPSNIILQRYKMGNILPCYMICQHRSAFASDLQVRATCIFITMLMIPAQNFMHLIVLLCAARFECCISPGFILVVGSWYKTREHASRSLFVFQSANAGFFVSSQAWHCMVSANVAQRIQMPNLWRWMSYFSAP